MTAAGLTPMRETILSRFLSTPVLLAPEGRELFEGCLTALATHPKFNEFMQEPRATEDDFWPAPDDWRAMYRPYIVRDGILQIPVKGLLLSNFSFALGSWATGYSYIWRAFDRGLNDAGVKGIALLCHTPGGEVAENLDLVDKMYARRGEKPVRAFAHEFAYSAGYSLASVADQIIMSRTGGVGSIGVVTSHVDVSAQMEKAGIKVTLVYAGKHKVDSYPYKELSKDAQARMQERIDELMQIFVSTVARNRGMSEQAVRETEAMTFTASQATSNGLADSVGSLDDAVAAFAADLSSNEGIEDMAEKKENPAVDQAAVDAARVDGIAEGTKTGMAQGVTAERARIAAITGSEAAKARPASALKIALTTDMNADQASGLLETLAEEPKSKAEAKTDEPAPKGEKGKQRTFNDAMSKGNPDLGAAKGEEGQGGEDEPEMSVSDRILANAGYAPRK